MAVLMSDKRDFKETITRDWERIFNNERMNT